MAQHSPGTSQDTPDRGPAPATIGAVPTANTPPSSHGTSSADRAGAASSPGRAQTSWPARILSLVVIAAVLWWAITLLSEWIRAGRFPRAYEWTSGWPLVITSALALSIALGLWRRTSLPALAASVCAAGLFPSIGPELPTFSSNNFVFDGPFLMPLYAVIIVGLMLYVAAGPRRHPDHQRIVLGLLVACAANTKLFVRDGTGIHGLLLCWVALAVVATPPPRELWERIRGDRFARAFTILLTVFLLWIALTVVTGDSRTVGVRALQTVLLGAGLLYALAAGLAREGVGRAVGAFLVGIAACLGMALLGAMDAASTEGWSRVLSTRLRLFQSHPNIIGPYFASAVILCTVLLLWRGPQLFGPVVRRLMLLALLAGSAFALYRTGSTASILAVPVGLFVAAFVLFGPRIRRPRLLYGGIVLVALVGLGGFFSPLGNGLRESLEARTFEPASAIGQRYHFWRMAGETIAYSPIVGVGPSNTYFHARFAEPSYYDDARQTHHAHNLFLHIAEGSGIPGLLLFLAGLFGMLELYRRLTLGRSRRELALPAALLGVPIGILASNMLDLGQVQPAYVPHYFWIHIGLGVALAYGSRNVDLPDARRTAVPGTARQRWIRAAVLLAVVVPFGCFALIGDALILSNRLRAFTVTADSAAEGNEKDFAAYRGLVLGRTFFPAHIDAYKFEPQLIETISRRSHQNNLEHRFPPDEVTDLVIETWEAQVRDTPGRARVWVDLAHKCLRERRISRAGEALDKAEFLDPRGHQMGRTCLLRAWWHMARDEKELAFNSFFDAALSQGTIWSMVPHEFVPLQTAMLSNARRMMFVVTGPDRTEVRIPLDEILDDLGQYAVSIAAEDTVSARRHMRAIYAGFLRQNRPEEALRWFREYRAVIEHPIPSIIKQEFELLNMLDRRSEANALLDTMRPGDREVLEPDLLTGRLMESSAISMGAEEVALLDTFLDPLDTRDIFFEIALHTTKLRTASLLYATAGRWEDSVRTARRFLREYIDPNERRITTGTFTTSYLMPRGIPPKNLLDFCETIFPDHNVNERRTGGRSQIIDEIAEYLHRRWDPAQGDLVEEARERFWGTGPAGDGLVRRLESLRDTGTLRGR